MKKTMLICLLTLCGLSIRGSDNIEDKDFENYSNFCEKIKTSYGMENIKEIGLDHEEMMYEYVRGLLQENQLDQIIKYIQAITCLSNFTTNIQGARRAKLAIPVINPERIESTTVKSYVENFENFIKTSK